MQASTAIREFALTTFCFTESTRLTEGHERHFSSGIFGVVCKVHMDIMNLLSMFVYHAYSDKTVYLRKVTITS